MSNHGPFQVVGDEVQTTVDAGPGDTIVITASGFVDFGGAVAGLGAPIVGADGDGWATPSDYPAPALSKNSLIYRFGAGQTWYQGGRAVSPPAVPFGESGKLILRTNDLHPGDNSRGWTVSIDHTPAVVPSAAPNQPNLKIVSIEAIQVVQTPTQNVRLVAGKETLVRIYVDSGIRSGFDAGAGANRWPHVTGQLLLKNGAGTTLGMGMLSANAAGFTARPVKEMDPNEWGHSLNFRLPPILTTLGPVLLEATVWVQGHELDGGGWRATENQGVAFATRPQRQWLLPILVRDGDAGIAAPDFSSWTTALVEGVLPRYPMAPLDFGVNRPVTFTTFLPLSDLVGANQLVAQIATIALIGDPFAGVRAAIVAQNPSQPREYGGLGTPRVAFSVPSLLFVEGNSTALAHELGHAYGIYHAPRCNAPAPIDGRLPQSGTTDAIGWHSLADEIIPAGSDELMSWCDTVTWPSIAFYNIIFDAGVI